MFIRNVKKRVSSDREIGKNDAVICISGDPGSGKSTLMILFSIEFDKKFDLDRNVLYSPKRVNIIEKIIDELPVTAPVGLDEAIKAFFKHKWQSKDVKYLTEFFNICRKSRKVVIMCIPRFKDLAEYFRSDRVFFRIYILERGKAALFIRLPTPYGLDGWHWNRTSRVWEKWLEGNKRPTPYEMIKFFERHDPTYVGTFDFPILPLEMEKEYEKRVDAVKYDLSMEDYGVRRKEERARLVATASNLTKKGYTQTQIAAIMEVTQGTVSNMLQKRNT